MSDENYTSSTSYTSYSSSSFSASASASASAGGNVQSRVESHESQTRQSYRDNDGNEWTSESRTDPSGTTIRDTHRDAGGETRQQTTRYDSGGRNLEDGSGGQSRNQNRIEDVSDEKAEADKRYEENIEEEYAKREGGA